MPFSDDWKTLVQLKRLEIKRWKTMVKKLRNGMDMTSC